MSHLDTAGYQVIKVYLRFRTNDSLTLVHIILLYSCFDL